MRRATVTPRLYHQAMSTPVFETMISDLMMAQARAVEDHVRDLLRSYGIDPEDRTDGWEDRAREALSGLEVVDSIDASDLCRIFIETTIRPRVNR